MLHRARIRSPVLPFRRKMQRLLISEVAAATAHRPAGYLEDVMSKGKQEGGFILLEDETYRALCQKYRKPLYEFGPGALLSILIQQLTGKTSAACALCSARAKQMNAWGWLGCWRSREMIAQWLVEEAGKLGHKTDKDSVLLILTAVIREKLRPRPH